MTIGQYQNNKSLFYLSGILLLLGCQAAQAHGIGNNAVLAAPSVDASQVLKRLEGCFRVTYHYVDAGRNAAGESTDFDLGFTDKDRFLEWNVGKDVGGVRQIQHFGIVSAGPQGKMVIPHWIERWSDEGRGFWKQGVYMPDGKTLRYECTAEMRINQWRCRPAMKAAKPVIRDTKRTDYATLDRENSLQFAPERWIQVEINDKIAQDGSTVVSNEVGWIENTRLSDSECQAAIDYINKKPPASTLPPSAL